MTRRSDCSAELRIRRERARRPLLGALILGSTSLGLLSWLAGGETVDWAVAMPSSVLVAERPLALRAPQRGGRRGAASRPAGEDTFTLLVVDAHDGKPVGAEVACLELSKLAQQNALADAVQLDRMLARQSWNARADDAGRIVLQRPPEAALVAARSGKRFGLVRVSAAREVRLELFADSELAIELADDRGSPVARAEVVLRANGEVAMRSRTNERGLATFTHAGWLMASRPGPWSVAPEGLFRSSEALQLPPDDLPQEPIRLQRPLCGAVLVALSDLDGKPYRGTAEVALEGFASMKCAGPRVGRLEQEALGGFVRFESVELGLSVRATTTLRHILIEGCSRAPAERGTVARMELGFDGERTIVRGRAFGADRKPIRSSHMRVVWEGEWQGATNVQRRLTWTDERGVFAVALGTGIAPSAAPRGLRLRSMRESSGFLALDAALASGVHDVGDVRLEVRP